MAKNHIKKGHSNKWKWWEYAQSFSLLSNLVLDYLLLPQNEKRLSKAIGLEKSFRSLTYQNSDLIIPILFNIRHGLELFLKGVARKKFNISSKDLSNQNKYGHNLSNLYKELLKRAGKQNENKLLEKLQKLGIYVQKYHRFDIPKYPEDKNGYITLSVKDIKKLITTKNIKNIKDDLKKIYKKFNDIGSFIYRQEQKKCK
jgi:hypothetical protein